MCDRFPRKIDVQTSYKSSNYVLGLIFVVNIKFPWATYHTILPSTEELYCLNCFGYWKQCQYLTIIKIQNLRYRFPEIRVIIEAMTSYVRVLKCLRQIIRKAELCTICEKNRNSTSFPPRYRDFFFISKSDGQKVLHWISRPRPITWLTQMERSLGTFFYLTRKYLRNPKYTSGIRKFNILAQRKTCFEGI